MVLDLYYNASYAIYTRIEAEVCVCVCIYDNMYYFFKKLGALSWLLSDYQAMHEIWIHIHTNIICCF